MPRSAHTRWAAPASTPRCQFNRAIGGSGIGPNVFIRRLSVFFFAQSIVNSSDWERYCISIARSSASCAPAGNAVSREIGTGGSNPPLSASK
jgi:hypothetical protein